MWKLLIAPVLTGILLVGVCHQATQWAEDCEFNLAFAKTAGQDVIRQAKHMSKREAKIQLAWLLDAQAKTTTDIIREGWL